MVIVVDSSNIFENGKTKKSPPWNNHHNFEGGKVEPANEDESEEIADEKLDEELGDYYLENGHLRKTDGLNWILAALFVVADMAGGGIVALPTAIVRCQLWVGLGILAIMATMATTSAVMLGKAWVILLRRFPVYRTHCRKPYAEMGNRALGSKMKTFVSICVNFTQFGASTVFLLLSSKNIGDFIRAFFGVKIDFCLLIVVVALFLLPVTLLKSPQDFWPVVVAGMASTAIAVCLICLGSLLDFSDCTPNRELAPFKITNLLLALGTILFTYGGHSAFPTIQHDMKKPSHFKQSAILAFIIITVMNTTVVVLGGFTYGNSLRDSVINSIQTFWIQQAVNLMITAHCLLTVTLIINPLNQEVEEKFKVPQDFGVKRVLVRTAVMGGVVFMAATIPSFGAVLDLIGGSTVTLTSVVFPCLFYLYLAAGEKKSKEPKHLGNNDPVSFREMVARTRKSTLYYCGIIIFLGTAAGLIATGAAIRAIAATHFVPPCYLKSFLGSDGTDNSTLGVTNCCGAFQNISRYDDSSMQFCAKADLNFY